MKRLSLIAAFGCGLLLAFATMQRSPNPSWGMHPPDRSPLAIGLPSASPIAQPANVPSASPITQPANVPPANVPSANVLPATTTANEPPSFIPTPAATAASGESRRVAQAAADTLKPFDEVIQGTQRLEGLFTLYRDPKAGKLYLELQPHQLNINYLCTLTLESGLGEQGFYGGLALNDFLFTFRRVNDRVQFVLPNLFFRALPNDPLRRAIQRSFSSSVLQTLPIQSIHPQRQSLLIDLGALLLTDLPGLSQSLTSTFGVTYSLDKEKSYVGSVKAFPQNVELESVYGFSGGNSPQDLPAFIVAVPDSRSFNLRVRYSFSRLPTNHGYRPRLADDRIGYFITAYQNLSDNTPQAPFVRYINRWHLEKQQPALALSPPKQPIVFWIENTVPPAYREAVREGILMWNKAFEAAGYLNAIEARQMPDKAEWDPADIRYNTIRWISGFETGALGVGPSRVNPLTGEILDADIIISANFARYAQKQYRSLISSEQLPTLQSLAKLTGNSQICSYGMTARYLRQLVELPPPTPRTLSMMGNNDLCYGMEAARQLAIGTTARSLLQQVSPTAPADTAFVQAFLRNLVAHEVGHTLGLRHNFRASAMLPPDQLNDPEITRKKGLTASVMDYAAVNLAPVGKPQGEYFTSTIGPYDAWAIAYGYKPSGASSPRAETQFLNAIAQRAPEPDLAYATDEDVYSELDPFTHRFDLSGDLLTYAPWQLENAQKMWQRLDQRYPDMGESFSDVRDIFDEICEYYYQFAAFLTSYVGGQSFNRYRGGDAVGRLPFELVPLAQQRQALSVLQRYVFDDRQFRFSPNFLNKLAPSRWQHWGETPEYQQLDYPIYDRILLMQSLILRDLLATDRLARLRDADLKAAAGQALTIPDLFDFLQTSIWGEVMQPAETLQLSSLRRGLQREHLNQMIRMVLRQSRVPEDARTVARYELKQLRQALELTLRRRAKDLDIYTRAHLEETSDRIAKALDAELQSQ